MIEFCVKFNRYLNFELCKNLMNNGYEYHTCHIIYTISKKISFIPICVYATNISILHHYQLSCSFGRIRFNYPECSNTCFVVKLIYYLCYLSHQTLRWNVSAHRIQWWYLFKYQQITKGAVKSNTDIWIRRKMYIRIFVLILKSKPIVLQIHFILPCTSIVMPKSKKDTT